MKNNITTLLLLVLFTSGFSQYTPDNYFGRSSSRITKKCLEDIKLMSDILPGYRNLVDYVTVKISVKGEDRLVVAISNGEVITVEQKSILNSADLCSDIDIKIQFSYKDSTFDNYGNGKKIKEMNFTLYVVPDVEAEYSGNRMELEKSLSKSVMSHITDTTEAKKSWDAVVNFIVNENGEVKGAKIIRTSSNPKIDEWLLEATNKMQKWKPAQLQKGTKVEQKISIQVGGGRNPRRSTGGC